MGLLEEFEIDLSNVETTEYAGFQDDIYAFTIGDVYLKEGSKKNPEQNFIVFKYLLGEEGREYNEYFGLPLDPANPTDAELKKLSFYKSRLLSLGVSPEEVNSVSSEDLIGISGTFELRTIKSKANGQEYQNIRNFNADIGNTEKPAAAKKKAATSVDNPFA